MKTDSGPKNLIAGQINKICTLMLLDSGASVSCLSLQFAMKLNAKIQREESAEFLTAADGRNLEVCGSIDVTVGLNGLLVPHRFFVINGLHNRVICGLDFLTLTHCKLDLDASVATFYDIVALPLQQRAENSAVLRTVSCCRLPPRSESIFAVSLPQNFAAADGATERAVTAMIEPLQFCKRKHSADYLVARSVVDCKPQDRKTFCRVLNVSDAECVIRKGTPIAVISPAELLPTNNFQNHNISSVEVNKTQDKELTLQEKISFLQNMGLDLKRDDFNNEVFDNFCELLYNFKDLFALSLNDLTTGSNIMECPILVRPDAKPVRSRPYRLNDSMRAVVDKQLQELHDAGIIEPSEGSAFASPIVMVKKSTGEFRFCVDLRKINQLCLPLTHELPTLSDVTDVLARNKAKVLSVLDMKSAYFQLKITRDTADVTCFTTPQAGEWVYRRLPMGLAQSPYYMTLALRKLFRLEIGQFLIVYLDDLLLCSDSLQTHLEHLKIVFEKLREANLKLHPKKCNFLLRELCYLGHVFSAEGVRANPRKTAVVQNFPRPKTVKELRSFLGLVNFFRSRIKNFADKAFNLTKLLRKNEVFKWGPDQEDSFQSLKAALINPPIMALPDTSKPFILTTDASDKSISYNLSQQIDGKERFIEYGARGLRPAEKNYSTSQKEMLAIVVGINHFHEYLGQAEFTIRCDNIALSFLNSTKHVTGRLGRWNLLLSGYKYKIEHTKGKNNIVADTLSRLSLPATDADDPEVKLDERVMNIDNSAKQLWQIDFFTSDENNTQTGDVLSRERFAADAENTGTEVCALQQTATTAAAGSSGESDENNSADVPEVSDSEGEVVHGGDLDLSQSYDVGALQCQCPDFSALIEYIQNGVLPQGNDALARKIIFQSERFIWLDGVLWHLQLPRNKRQREVDSVCRQLAVPRCLRTMVLTSYHDKMCHIGPEKMYLTLRNKYFWPNLYTDIFQWAKTCVQCQQGKTLIKTRAPLRSLQSEATIFEKWHIDHLKLPTSGEFSHILVLVDSFSLFSILLPAKTTTAEETAELLYHNLFTVYTCRSLLSDRGSAFRSKLIRELCKLLNIKQVFTSAQHPATNARCESYNRNILNSLRTACSGHKNWPTLLSTIGHSFRTSVIKNLGFSPYKIVFGIEPNLPVDNLLQPKTKNLPQSVETYVKNMEPQFKILREAVRENQLQANLRTTEQYNKKPITKAVHFPVGTRVWLFNPTTPREKYAHKITPKWAGPYLIIGANPEFHVYKLQHCITQKICPSWIHANRLQKCYDERDRFYTNETQVATAGATDKIINSEPAKITNTRGSGEEMSRPNSERVSAGDITGNGSSIKLCAGNTSKQLTVDATSAANDWHEIVKILAHYRRGKTMYYRVQWLDNSKSWLPQCDVTEAATDAYWLAKREKQLNQKQRRKRRT